MEIPIWYQVLGTQCLVPSPWYPVLGTKYLVPSAWYQVLGTSFWYRVLGTKYLVPNTWYKVPGTKYLVSSTWYQVLGTKYLGTKYLDFFSVSARLYRALLFSVSRFLICFYVKEWWFHHDRDTRFLIAIFLIAMGGVYIQRTKTYIHIYLSVSYTHLTLPTIYSV